MICASERDMLTELLRQIDVPARTPIGKAIDVRTKARLRALVDVEPPAQPPAAKTGTVADISDVELLRRAVESVRPSRGLRRSPRWAAVAAAFSLGSGYSMQLCKRFGLDPDAMVKR